MPNFLTNDDTIVAIATPMGESGIGVVRLSGPESILIVGQLTRQDAALKSAPSHTLHHAWIYDKDDIVDEAVVALFKSPRSYTGEDVVEISSHGSPAVLKKIMALCQQAGARPANPGEFSLRAYLNEKMDLSQAEAVAGIIHAKSDKARRAAADQLRGTLSDRLKRIRAAAVDVLAQLEANLDFVEEDIPPVERNKIEQSVAILAGDVADLLSTSLKGRWFRDGVHVALAGKPNVGKSSLFNALLAQERAIVTDTPGTTRDTLQEKFEWEGIPFVLTDTAGLRKTKDPVETEGAARARGAHQIADTVIIVLDGSEPLGADDRDILDEVKNRNAVIVINKIDMGIRLDLKSLPQNLASVFVSAKEVRGLLDLKNALIKSVPVAGGDQESIVVTNLRHVQQLEKARNHFLNAIHSLKDQKSEETIAVDVRQALEDLGGITGETVGEDVLASIFRQFCIGK